MWCFPSTDTVMSELPAAVVSAAGPPCFRFLRFFFGLLSFLNSVIWHLLCHQRPTQCHYTFLLPDVTNRDNKVPPNVLPPVDSAPPPATVNTGKHLASVAPAKVWRTFCKNTDRAYLVKFIEILYSSSWGLIKYIKSNYSFFNIWLLIMIKNCSWSFR